MTNAIISLIVFPLIVFVVINFVFGAFDSSNPSITNLQFLINCPMPIENQIAMLVPPSIGGAPNPPSTVGGTYVLYNVSAPNTSTLNATGTGSYFYCFIQNVPNGVPNPAVNIVIRDYGRTVLQFPVGWFSFVGDTINAVIAKISLVVQLLFAYFTLPAVVTGIQWFTLVNGVLFALMAIGIYMLIRSGT